MKPSMIMLGIFGILLLLGVVNLYSTADRSRPSRDFAYSAFLEHLENDRVASVRLSGTAMTGQLKSGEAFATRIPSVEQGVAPILAKKVSLTIAPSEDDLPSLLGVIISWLPFLLYILALWLFVGRPLGRIELRLQSLESSVSPASKDA